MQKLWVPRSPSSACSPGKHTEGWQGCIVSAAYPQASFLQPDGALHVSAIYPHPAVLGGPCSLHWYTVRQMFPGLSHILPDREGKAAPCQHSNTRKGCKASTRKNLGSVNQFLIYFVLFLQQDTRLGKKCVNILNGFSKDIYFNAGLTGSQFLLCPEGENSNTFCRYPNKGIAAQSHGKIQARAPAFYKYTLYTLHYSKHQTQQTEDKNIGQFIEESWTEVPSLEHSKTKKIN